MFRLLILSKQARRATGLLVCIVLSALPLHAQLSVFTPWQAPVWQSGEWLSYPFAGGLNAPQFSTADLNHDGTRDIVVFERTGNAMSAFLGNVAPGDSNLTHAPAYERYLPELKHWATFRDFNHDGAADIFAAAAGNPGEYVQVFKGFYRNDTLMFKQMTFQYPDCPTCDPRWLRYRDQSNWYDLTVNFIGIPAIEDIDQDGDLDLLAFEAATGEHLWAWHNQAADNNWPDTLLFQLANTCWGGFADPALAACSKILTDEPDSCAKTIMRPGAANAQTKLHPGAALLAFDPDNDHITDLLAGTLGLNCMTFLQNGGTTNQPWITAQDTMFPFYNTAVDLFVFPAAHQVDLDLDSTADLLIAPNGSVIMQDINNVWAYRRTGSQYELIQQDYLSGEMIDVGTGAHPALADLDGDGLTDLVVGNFGHLEGANPKFGSLTYYKNTGTATAPVFELISTDWLAFSQFSPANFDFTPAFGDLDGDKDPDLVVGSATGVLYFAENTTVPGGAVTFGAILTDWFQVDPGVSSTPALADINRDGLPDLIVGERTGNINFYANKGTAQQPVFSASPDQENWGGILVPASGIGYSTPALFYSPDSTLHIVSGSQNGPLYAWDQADASGNPFPAATGWNWSVPGKRSAPALADLDGDHLLELAVGLQSGGIRLYKTGIPAAGTSSTRTAPKSPRTGMLIRPNPARQNIQLYTPISADWQIHDQYGRLQASGKKQTGQLNIDLSGWPVGRYTLSCQSGSSEFETSTFIVVPE